jgi:hypothetical protein
MTTTVDHQKLKAAWSRLGATLDGRMARAHLVSIILDSIPAGQNSGAVHEGVGRHNLARELIELLDAGNEHAGEANVVIVRTVNAGESARGARRRVGPSES